MYPSVHAIISNLSVCMLVFLCVIRLGLLSPVILFLQSTNDIVRYSAKGDVQSQQQQKKKCYWIGV